MKSSSSMFSLDIIGVRLHLLFLNTIGMIPHNVWQISDDVKFKLNVCTFAFVIGTSDLRLRDFSRLESFSLNLLHCALQLRELHHHVIKLALLLGGWWFNFKLIFIAADSKRFNSYLLRHASVFWLVIYLASESKFQSFRVTHMKTYWSR